MTTARQPSPAAADARRFDVIVIGSGIGGLTTASLLAQLAGKRVLVLERHYKLGGFTHTFTRQGYTWDPGLHYVGGMQPGAQGRQLFDLVTRRGVDWCAMPEHFDRFMYPDLTFAVPNDRARYAADLCAAFPHEAAAIHAYFADVMAAGSWFQRRFMGKSLPTPLGALLAWPGRDLALQTTQTVLDRHFRDPRLKAVLASQWGDYGLPPHRSAFVIHAMIVQHYFDGGFYPAGGAHVIADAIVPVITAAGGDCRVNHEVTAILHQGGKAHGVRVHVKHGDSFDVQEFHAPLIISDAGAHTTYLRLLDPALNLPEQRTVQAAPRPDSVVNLYVGFKSSPTSLGVAGENLWIFAGGDHRALYDARNDLAAGKAQAAFVSFGSLRDPHAKQHTAQIVTWIDPVVFDAWRDRAWKRRGDDYEALKATISDALLDLVDRRVPGFRDLVAYHELSTPLSVENFLGHPHGAVYGLPATPAHFGRDFLSVRSSINGLLLTGTDVATLGIMGALMGGVATTATVLGPTGFPKIFGAAQRYAAAPRPAPQPALA